MTTTTAFVLASGNALVDPSGNMLVFGSTPLPGPPVPTPAQLAFDPCVSQAEMHRQAAQAAAKATLTGKLLQRAMLAADQQYFLDVIACAVQFGRSVPNAVEGLKETVKRLQQSG